MVDNLDTAIQLIDVMKERFPQHTLVLDVGIPVAEAAVDMIRGNHLEAIDRLEVTRPFEKRHQHAIYLRGLALLEAGRDQEAAAEFQRLRNLQTYTIFIPVQSLGQLGLARSLAAAGKTAEARAAYQAFFELWAEADEDVPILLEARAEYARL